MCDWCPSGEDGQRFLFNMAGFDDRWPWRTPFGHDDHATSLCVVHRESRLRSERFEWDGPQGWCKAKREFSHRCACGHTSSYHNVEINTDHAEMAAKVGVTLCRACARFVAAATRRRLTARTPSRAGHNDVAVELDDVDDIFEDPLRGLSESEVAAAARKFFRKFEGANQ